MSKQPSLKRPLIFYPLAIHFAILLASFAVLLSVAMRVDSGGLYSDEQIIPIIARAVERDASGKLSVVMTPELADLHAGSPRLWFVAEDDNGGTVTFGQVPDFYSSFFGRLSDLSYAQLRGRTPPYELSAVVRRETTDIGALTILGHGALTELSLMVVLASSITVLPIFLLFALASLVITPVIVKRSLAGLTRIASEAEKIDADKRGGRLTETHVPREIAPLVRAVNQALERLDEGYEQQQRFIASASHELRTPIAVLRSKVEVADNEVMHALAPDVQRLATLTEQMLDLQRLQSNRNDEELDLAMLVRQVAGDMAPLLIAGGNSIEVQVLNDQTIIGDAAALERALMNLVQNAIDHGGKHVVVRVNGSVLEVEDDGPGIPPEERERVFEPFHRLRPRATGSGLGLNLVQQVVAQHGGRVEIVDAPGGGTVIRIALGSTS